MTALALPEGGGVFDTGPWVSSMYVGAAGRVYSKSNYRRERQGQWRAIADYEEQLAMEMRAARPDAWPAPGPEVPFGERPQFVVVLIARTAMDAGNISKSVLDAAEGVLYADDAQVRAVCDLTERDRKNQGLLAAFAALEPDAATADVFTAQTELLKRVQLLLAP